MICNFFLFAYLENFSTVDTLVIAKKRKRKSRNDFKTKFHWTEILSILVVLCSLNSEQLDLVCNSF